MKSRGLYWLGFAFLLAAVVWAALAAGTTQASRPSAPSITRGAMLYDNWPAVLKTSAPDGNMPLWASQTTNTASGADTWRCVSCHGWDYQGKNGAYRSGSNFTGFPGVYTAGQTLSVDEIVAVLQGKNDPKHDYSKYLDAASLTDVATFIKTGLVDDSQYIDMVALKVVGGNLDNGKQLYTAQCAKCHGDDGLKKMMRFQGMDAGLGTIARVDPWRFLHKTRFGTPGTEMVVGYDLNWTAQEGRDVLLYAQTLATSLAAPTQPPSVGEHPVQPAGPAGQSQSILVGLITALGAITTGLGFAILLGALLVGVIFIVVWSLRERRK